MLQKRSMNWDDLRVFTEVRRTRTLAGAARALGVNATTVGRRITALEQSVGAQLFLRTSDGLVCTDAAEAIAENVEQIERQAQLIEKRIGGEDTRLEGNVVVTTTSTFAGTFLLDHLVTFRNKHPGILLELNSADSIVNLSRGDVDLAIRFRSPGTGPGTEEGPQVDVIAKRVGTISISVYASSLYLERVGAPRSIYAVEGHDVVMPSPRAEYLPGSSWSKEVADSVRTTLRCDGLIPMAAAASAGFGLCALPSFVALSYRNLERIGPPEVIATRDVWLLMPRDLRAVARVRAVWDFVVAVFDEWAPLLSGEVVPLRA